MWLQGSGGQEGALRTRNDPGSAGDVERPLERPVVGVESDEDIDARGLDGDLSSKVGVGKLRSVDREGHALLLS